MKTLKNLIPSLAQKKSFGFGILDNHVESPRGGFSKASFEEKRQSTRVEISVPVWYQVKKNWSKWLLGKSIDHSGTGIRLALPAGVKPGTEISLRMKLPDAPKPIDIKGIVVWVEPISNSAAFRTTVECGVAFKRIESLEHKEKLFHLIANKLCAIGLQLTKNLISSPAQSLEDLKSCYRIVYDGYLARGYCQPNESKMHYHYYSFLPQSRTFLLKENGNLVGTITVIVDSPCGLPMDSLFSRELDHLRGEGRILAEVSLLAIVPCDKKKKLFSLTNLDKQARLFRLFKILREYARDIAGVTDVIIGVHPKHETLYKYLYFKPLGSAKSYPGARGNPALPLHLNFPKAEQNCSNCLKSFFLVAPEPMEVINSGLKIDSKIVQQFLCDDYRIWRSIPAKSQKYLKQCYPGIKPPSSHGGLKFFKNNFLKISERQI